MLVMHGTICTYVGGLVAGFQVHRFRTCCDAFHQLRNPPSRVGVQGND